MHTGHRECISCGCVWLPYNYNPTQLTPEQLLECRLYDMGKCPNCGKWNRRQTMRIGPERLNDAYDGIMEMATDGPTQ